MASEGPLEHAVDDVTPRTTEAGKARGSFVMRMAILSIVPACALCTLVTTALPPAVARPFPAAR